VASDVTTTAWTAHHRIRAALTIVFVLTADAVLIEGVYYGGQDVEWAIPAGLRK
jgi:hypothetical protein